MSSARTSASQRSCLTSGLASRRTPRSVIYSRAHELEKRQAKAVAKADAKLPRVITVHLHTRAPLSVEHKLGHANPVLPWLTRELETVSLPPVISKLASVRSQSAGEMKTSAARNAGRARELS